MDFFTGLLNLFNRPDQVSDSTFKEIHNALDSGEKCRFCTQELKFPIGVLPCGHLYDAHCLANDWSDNRCPECETTCEYYDQVASDQSVIEIKISRRERSPSPVRSQSPESPKKTIEDSVQSPRISPVVKVASPVQQTPTSSFRSQSVEIQPQVGQTDTHHSEITETLSQVIVPKIEITQQPEIVESNQETPSLTSSPNTVSDKQTKEPSESETKEPSESKTKEPSKSKTKEPSESKTKELSESKTKEPSESKTEEKLSKFKYEMYDSLTEIDRLPSVDQQIWALITNVHLIEDSILLLSAGTFFDITFEVLKHYIPVDLHHAASELKPSHLGELLRKNQNVGTVIMYGMILFLALEYLSRSKEFRTRSKFQKFFRKERFHTWLNAGHLTLGTSKQENLEQLFRGFPSDI